MTKSLQCVVAHFSWSPINYIVSLFINIGASSCIIILFGIYRGILYNARNFSQNVFTASIAPSQQVYKLRICEIKWKIMKKKIIKQVGVEGNSPVRRQ